MVETVGNRPLDERLSDRAAVMWRVNRLDTQEIAFKLMEEFWEVVYEHQVYNALTRRWDYHPALRKMQASMPGLRRARA